MNDKSHTVGNSIQWASFTEYYDEQDGLQISKKDAIDKTKYIILKIEKNVKINETKTHGTIKYTVTCRKQPQQQLW